MKNFNRSVTNGEVEIYAIVTTSSGREIELITYYDEGDKFIEYDGFMDYIIEEDPTISIEEVKKINDEFIIKIKNAED